MAVLTSSQKLRHLTDTKEKSVVDFTSEMTFIVNAMFNKNKKDDDIIGIRDGYLIAKRENPECIIVQVGPYFWKYRDTISSGNLNPLLNSDFRDDISAQGYMPEVSSYDQIQAVMSKVKRTWHLFTPVEQETMKKKFKFMVSCYATYLGACKQIQIISDKNSVVSS
jgi:hypothetical protein